MGEKDVLLIVHGATVARWARKDKRYYISRDDANRARVLLEKITRARRQSGIEVLRFEHDPWRPEYKPQDPIFSWDDIAKSLKGKNVQIAGLRRTVCVDKVNEELSRRGINVKVDEDLTID